MADAIIDLTGEEEDCEEVNNGPEVAKAKPSRKFKVQVGNQAPSGAHPNKEKIHRSADKQRITSPKINSNKGKEGIQQPGKEKPKECSESTSKRAADSSAEKSNLKRSHASAEHSRQNSKGKSQSSCSESNLKKKPKVTVSVSHLRRPKTAFWAKAPDDPPYSDWKLTVKYYDDASQGPVGRQASYSIHRMIVGHKCDYFDRIFRGGFSESQAGKSTHPLKREHCKSGVVSIKHFEALLDWFYSKKLKFTPASSMGMLCLSDYFSVETLKEEVWSYIRKELKHCSTVISEKNSSSLATFYRSAKIMGASALQQEVIELCVHNPSYLSSKLGLSTTLQDIGLWLDVFKAKTKLRELRSNSPQVWSQLFSDFLRNYPALVDSKNFEFLTSKEMLPIISSDAGLSLMEHQQQLTGTSSEKALTCLQGRCIRALIHPETGKWKIGPDYSTRNRLNKLSPVVLSEMLMQSMSSDVKQSDEM
eukprot:jgi/Psemu1/37888/gm1.37888_g